MIHYIALVWNAQEEAELEAADRMRSRLSAGTAWREVVLQPGLCVLARLPAGPNVDEIYPFPKADGVILGRLFGREYVDAAEASRTPSPVRIDQATSIRLKSTGGTCLKDIVWGQYVAFICGEDGALHILRDPTGGVPCHHTRLGRIDVYFAQLDDLESLGEQRLTINHRFVLGYLVHQSINTPATGLNEVDTVLAGQHVCHQHGLHSASFYWNPLTVAESTPVEDAEEATRLLRRTVRACVHAWASCFEALCLRLSGGLDSSILAACLADAPGAPRVLAKNDYDSGPSTDERTFARLVAQRCGFELMESCDDEVYSIEHGLILPRALSPSVWIGSLDFTRKLSAFYRERGFTAEFSGVGGDEIFHRYTSLHDSVDFAYRHGLRPRLFSIAMNDAALDQASLWQVLRLALRYGRARRPLRWLQLRGSATPKLMVPEVAQQAIRDESFLHPLLQGASPIAPCKFQQAMMIAANGWTFHIPPLAEYNPVRVFPLLSQPLIELALRTPVYVLRDGGQDRSLARRAFAADLPREVIERNSKAMGTPHLYKVLMGNRPILRDLLLDGFLVRNGFVSRDRLERALEGRDGAFECSPTELVLYLDIEGWARPWLRKPARAAA